MFLSVELIIVSVSLARVFVGLPFIAHRSGSVCVSAFRSLASRLYSSDFLDFPWSRVVVVWWAIVWSVCLSVGRSGL